LDLGRIADLIKKTNEIGGQVAMGTWRLASWIRRLGQDEDAAFLVEGFAYGFDWEATEPEPFEPVENFVDEKYAAKAAGEIAAEFAAGRVVRVPPEWVVGISAIGIVDKEQSGMIKVRLIHDLSRPGEGSVNDHTEIFERKFTSVKQACSLLRPHAWMAKVDLSKAYRSIPVHPRHWRMHAFEWEGKVYSDLRLPFGNRAAPGVFDRITQALVRCMRARGFPATLGYIDDFFVVCT
jgi:hypothetical protein